MKIPTLLIALTTLLACQQGLKPSPEPTNPTTTPEAPQPNNNPNIFTENQYRTPTNQPITIQNGYPKGGLRYTAPDGEVYSYAVFWSRIINATDDALVLHIDLSAEAHPIINVPGAYFQILVPEDTMTLDRMDLPTYGLEGIPTWLDAHRLRPSAFERTIRPHEASGLYFILLISVEEATGMTRTSLLLRGQDLVYQMKRYSATKPVTFLEEREFPCGRIHLAGLRLRP